MIIGIIAVFKCDGCGQIKTVHTDAEHEDLLHTWNVGKKTDHCPACFSTAKRTDETVSLDLTIERITTTVLRRVNGQSAYRSTPLRALEKEAA